MTATANTKEELLAEIEGLRLRLEEAEETLRAIGSGEVDAFVVTGPDGEQQVFTLKGAEQPYRIMVETMSEGAATLTTDGTILYCNSRLAAMLQVPQERLTGKQLLSYVAPADLPLLFSLLNECTEEHAKAEMIMLTETGNAVPVFLSCCSHSFPGNSVVSVVITDLTQQKRNEEIAASEAALRTSEERLALATSATLIGMFDVDIAKGTVLWTQTHEAIFGYAPATTTTEHGLHRWTERVLPEDLPLIEAESRRCMQERTPLEMQYRIIWPDGSLHWVETRGVYQYDSVGKSSRLIGGVRDITDQKQIEEALRKNEKRLSDIYTSMSEGLALHEIVYDNLGKAVDYLISDVNPVFESITGIKRSNAIGKKASELYGTGEAPYIDRYAEVASTGEPTSFEVYFVPMNKHFHISAFSPDNGRFAAIFQDITERKLAEEVLTLKNSELEATKKLAEDKRRWLAAVMDALPIGIAITDVLGGTIQSNGAYEQVWGESRPETRSVEDYAAYKAWWVDTDTPVAPDEWASALAVRTGETVTGQVMRIQRFDGSIAFVFNSASPVRDADGRIVGCAVAIQDISELKQVEKDLRESEERHRVLSETMLQGVVHQDASGTIISMNPAAERILGKSREDFLGITSIDTEHDTIRENGELFPGMEHPTMVALRTGMQVRGVVMGVYNPKLEEYRWIGIDAVPVFRQGEDIPSEVYSVFGDITERKTAEKELRSSEQRIQQALHVSRSFTFDWLPATDQVIRSASCAAILNLTDDEAVKDTGDHFFKSVHPDDRARFEQILGNLTPASDSYMTEYRYVSKDGSEITLEEIGQATFDDSGRMQRLVGVSTDITLRKKAELALRIAYDELELRVAERTKELAATIDHLQIEILERELAEKKLLKETAERLHATEDLREKERLLIQQSRQAAMGEMIGNIAHQWRQPLNTLGLYTQKLGVLYGMPSFNKEFLDNSIVKSMEIIQHMSKTIDDFRNYFKPEKEKTDFFVVEAIRNTLSLLDGNFNNPKITIEFVEHDNPVINGYQNEFAQVFLNILNNARDAIIEREIADAKITITICSENNCAVVTVSDNAGGIPDEVINKVFDPYFTTKGPQQGTGIGLFMSKTIIEKNMGGRLAVRNTDIGAEFRIEVEHGIQN